MKKLLEESINKEPSETRIIFVSSAAIENDGVNFYKKVKDKMAKKLTEKALIKN